LVKKNKILLAFYGDDFTGSTDALEFISRAGAKTILFTETPTIEQLNAFPDLDAYGVAGKTRSLNPSAMEMELIPAFEMMKSSAARHIHYKVCSTFDSSPTIGSIGKAIDCGATVFNNKTIPVLGGMPALGRYCLFGNLFARMGIGSEGNIYRLDSHPSMSKHPVTPASESDLRLHLGQQTNKAIGLIDLLHLKMPIEMMNEKNQEEVVLIDTLYDDQLLKIGEWLDAQITEGNPLFSVGSSGIEMALGMYWNKMKILTPVTEWKHPGKASPLLVLSGSCSPVSAAQIAYARAIGFEEVILDAVKICNDNRVEEAVFEKINYFLQQQKNVIVHTGEKQFQNLSSRILGMAMGTIASVAAEKSLVKRVVIAGGDTSSYAARAMQIEAVKMIAPLISGAPLCKAISKNKFINGLEVNFKGGQVGSENYFALTLAAVPNPASGYNL
jgi:uncharacterized protein YgbK (DUF1537 family)